MVLFYVVLGVRMGNIFSLAEKMIWCKFGAWKTERLLHGERGITHGGVAFDSYWIVPNPDGTGENVVYRFGSVGQDTQLLLWDLAMDEIVVPLRCYPPGGSPTFSGGSPPPQWDNVAPLGMLISSPKMRDVPKISPVVSHRVHTEPLSGLVFTAESVLTACREGHIKVWTRPGHGDSNQQNAAAVDAPLVAPSKDKSAFPPSKIVGSAYKQPASILLHE